MLLLKTEGKFRKFGNSAFFQYFSLLHLFSFLVIFYNYVFEDSGSKKVLSVELKEDRVWQNQSQTS